MLLLRKAGTFTSMLGAAAIAAGLGGAAIAGPGAPPAPLTPTSELSSGGGVSAPGASAPAGGAEAPAPAPEAAPVEDAAPVEAAPAPTTEPVPAPTETPDAEDAPAAPDAVTPDAAPEPSEIEPAPAPEDPVVAEPEVPTGAEVLGADKPPLVPVAVLSAPVESASEGAALVTMADPDAEVRAIAAQEEGDGREDEAEEDDEDEIIIPVDPNGAPPDDGTRPDTDGGGSTPGINVPARAAPGGPQLALTGLELRGPLGAGVVLLIIGGFLRITVRPTSVPARA